MMSPFVINDYKKHRASKKADLADEIVLLELKDAKYALAFEVDLDIDGRLSNVKDLNTLLEPTEGTYVILKRWETVHQIDTDYPYPENVIKNEDWIGINKLLNGETEDE